MRVLTTPAGVRVGIAGAQRPDCAPTLLAFATDVETAFSRHQSYSRVGRALMRRGFVCAAVDVPCHGQDRLPGETGEMADALADWRRRIESGDLLMPPFVARVRDALDLLIDSGISDPEAIAVCGTSRGGFAALHVAAAEPRVKCAAAFAPVTDLMALREFRGAEDNRVVNCLALRNVAGELAAKPVWIVIGCNDARVGTDRAVELARLIVAKAVELGIRPRVELRVAASEGHSVPRSAHGEAVRWIREQIGG